MSGYPHLSHDSLRRIYFDVHGRMSGGPCCRVEKDYRKMIWNIPRGSRTHGAAGHLMFTFCWQCRMNERSMGQCEAAGVIAANCLPRLAESPVELVTEHLVHNHIILGPPPRRLTTTLDGRSFDVWIEAHLPRR